MINGYFQNDLYLWLEKTLRARTARFSLFLKERKFMFLKSLASLVKPEHFYNMSNSKYILVAIAMIVCAGLCIFDAKQIIANEKRNC